MKHVTTQRSIGNMTFTGTTLKEGCINTLLGPPGSGKTNVANFIMEMALKNGFTCLTNINYFTTKAEVAEAIERGFIPHGVEYRSMPKNLHVVRKFSDLVLHLLQSEKNTVWLDEAGIFASSTNVMSKNVRQIKELSYIIRHLQASFVLICQAKKSIAPDLRSTLVTYEMRIRKVTEKYRKLTISKAEVVDTYNGEQEVHFNVVDDIGRIPLTSLPWDGYFLPKFDFDIDLTETFNRLGEYNSIRVREVGPDIIRELKEASEDNSEKRTYTSIREHAAELRTTAQERFNELRDSGKYSKRSEITNIIAEENKKSYQWAWAACRNMEF